LIFFVKDSKKLKTKKQNKTKQKIIIERMIKCC